uniref:Uncharacterized protein n=1 Tax=Aegilops tauschii subsp. strangulata TaxID=200361 RepID=A0A453H9B9_AEGTS
KKVLQITNEKNTIVLTTGEKKKEDGRTPKFTAPLLSSLLRLTAKLRPSASPHKSPSALPSQQHLPPFPQSPCAPAPTQIHSPHRHRRTSFVYQSPAPLPSPPFVQTNNPRLDPSAQALVGGEGDLGEQAS